MTTKSQTTNLRYYESNEGILEVVFTGTYRSPYFRYEIRRPDGTLTNDHLRGWLKKYYPQIWQDLQNDPLV